MLPRLSGAIRVKAAKALLRATDFVVGMTLRRVYKPCSGDASTLGRGSAGFASVSPPLAAPLRGDP